MKCSTVSDESDDDDVKEVLGTFDTWDVDQQMAYIEQTTLRCENLVKDGVDGIDCLDAVAG